MIVVMNRRSKELGVRALPRRTASAPYSLLLAS